MFVSSYPNEQNRLIFPIRFRSVTSRCQTLSKVPLSAGSVTPLKRHRPHHILSDLDSFVRRADCTPNDTHNHGQINKALDILTRPTPLFISNKTGRFLRPRNTGEHTLVDASRSLWSGSFTTDRRLRIAWFGIAFSRRKHNGTAVILASAHAEILLCDSCPSRSV